MLIEAARTRLLVDAGLPLATLQRQLLRAGLTVKPNALIVTHAHGDHCRHAAELSEHFQAPLFVSEATRRSVRLGGRRTPRVFGPRAPFAIGDITVTAVTVPHDAPQVSLRFEHARPEPPPSRPTSGRFRRGCSSTSRAATPRSSSPTTTATCSGRGRTPTT